MRSILKLRFWFGPKIFLTYRRTDIGHAGRLYAELIHAFPRKNVFFDIGTLEGGEEFPEAIERTVNICDALIAIIGRDWLTCKKGDRRRLDIEEDFVRREIAMALKRRILVIPLLVQGAEMPVEDDLPENLKPLANRNAMVLSDRSWDYDVKQIIDRLERVAPSKESTPHRVFALKKLLLIPVALAIVTLAIWGAWRLGWTGSVTNTVADANSQPTVSDPPRSNTFVPEQPRTPPELSELKVYFGNLHAHSSYSDGSGTPDEAYQYASNQGGLDFLAITDHNHANSEQGLRSEVDDQLADRLKDGLMIATDPALYEKTIQASTTYTRDDDFVALYGQEYSTVSSGDHLNVYSVNSVIDVPNGRFDLLYDQWLPKHPEVSFIQFNHPWQYSSDPAKQSKHYGLDDYGGSYEKLRDAVNRYTTLIEVVSGPAFLTATGPAKLEGEASYRFYLTRGFRVAPTAGQDNHFRTWGTATDARTGVLARRLTAADIVEALKSRRCYATTDKNVKVWFTLNRAIMGSEINAQRSEIRIDYVIDDDDEPHAAYEVMAVYGSLVIPDLAIEAPIGKGKGKHQAQTRLNVPADTAFVYLKIKQTSADAGPDFVLTSPVWLKFRA